LTDRSSVQLFVTVHGYSGHQKWDNVLRYKIKERGSQYTWSAFTGVLQKHDIRFSMDGKGRAMDNILVERL